MGKFCIYLCRHLAVFGCSGERYFRRDVSLWGYPNTHEKKAEIGPGNRSSSGMDAK